MRTHLQFKHPSIDLGQSGNQHNPLPGANARQSPLDFMSKKTMTVEKYQRTTRKLAIMCAVDGKPTCIVEGPGFKYFCNELNQEYKMPCRKTVSKYWRKFTMKKRRYLLVSLRVSL